MVASRTGTWEASCSLTNGGILSIADEVDLGKTKREYRSLSAQSQQSKSSVRSRPPPKAHLKLLCIIAKYLENVNRCSKAVDENEKSYWPV